MRSSLIMVSTLLLLSSCTFPWSAPAPTKQVEYPTTQSGSPAAVYCTKKGWQVTYEKNPSIPNMDMIYCTPMGGMKVDAWQYMGEETSKTGVTTPPAL